MNLLDGTFSSKNLQVGSLCGQKIEISIRALSVRGLGLTVETSKVVETSLAVGTGSTTTQVPTTTYTASGTPQTTMTTVTTSANDPFARATYDWGKNSEDDAYIVYEDQQSYEVQPGVDFANYGSDTDKCLSVSSFAAAGATMKLVQNAIDLVSTQRANLGAIQNRLEHTIANLDITSENTSAAESRVRDTDMAKEMVTYSKNNILAQAGQSMLAQANQSTQGVLSLLG
ncbi:MAG: hypothetical protein K6F00_02745 [Lachnospiraceae bacterium]|nr:hypothetical protein [Lachnospiraceae bacterium]